MPSEVDHISLEPLFNKGYNKTTGGIRVQDPMLELASGLIPGHSCINKFGRSSAITTTNTWEIWDGNAAYSFPATALMTHISQTTNQAALQGGTIEVQGLDANWALVFQDVDLDGTNTETPVALATPLIRAFRMKIQENVVGSSPIRLHNAAENQDYAVISTGNNQTLMAIYTVPDDKTAFVTNYYGTANPGGGAPTRFDIRLWARDNENGYEKQLKHMLGVSADLDAYGHFQHIFKPYYKFTKKTDVFLTGSPTGASVDTSAGFDLILVDN